eukprot:jgi/Botrbrau1/3160/Bobra.0070s0125.1
MEFMAGGDLAGALWREDTYRWTKRGPQVAYDIAKALAYFHSNNLIHMDVKSANVLLALDGRAKLCDVGVATWLTSLQTHKTLPCWTGTFPYVAPEVLLSGKAGCSADIYSFGVVLWEIVTGAVPKRGCMRTPRVPEECSQEVADLITRCCSVHPEERPTAADLMLWCAAQLGTSPEELTLSPSAQINRGLTCEHCRSPCLMRLLSLETNN